MASALDGARSIQRIGQRANRSAKQSIALDVIATKALTLDEARRIAANIANKSSRLRN
jgi:hypothetical protein